MPGYIDGKWGTEKKAHISLKNTAAMILLSEGFAIDQIKEEARFDSNPVDVCAVAEDGSLVMIECEANVSSSPPPLRQVSFTNSLFDEGHQAFVLTRDGLYELVDRRGGVLVPCETIQTSLMQSHTRGLGRWFANDSQINELPKLTEKYRWSHSTMPDTEWLSRENLDYHQNRWNADGNKPAKTQPTAVDLFDPVFDHS